MKMLKIAALATLVACAGMNVVPLCISEEITEVSGLGVCPPFKLRDEQGKIIDPIHSINDTVPYSPKQTCGSAGCHDYSRITEGFHFTQGKGEALPPEYAARYNWVSFPGNYGGNWCSPAPLYRQLAPKKSSSARTIDMTSFDFVTATCGNCHPGGGPLEYDRDGYRYDERMRDPTSGMQSGGENGLDGDYYKARWSETGVIEADCPLCHIPEYDLKKRNAQLANLNFRWAATEGAGFGKINGKIASGDQPRVVYDLSRFDSEGNVVLHIAPEPRNETCLDCHFKPDWKKRGAAYSSRTDVHMTAGLRCVDCHAAGNRAADPRIRGHEVHQVGKGDDPSGWVQNDLDGTVRSCEDCHLIGWRNAPRATHEWLPPLHLDRLSCQACHIPTRAVKSALVQASDVYNPAPRISPPGKHIWTFYDQEMNFWNHYGELDLFTGTDEPTNVTRPTLVRYKGKIYPVNRVHSAWVGYEEEGKPGLNQLFMQDFYKMWIAHQSDSARSYPQLALIKDDNKDEHLEINRPEEIDAVLEATRDYLTRTGFPLQDKRLVWVSDDRVYYSSRESRVLAREEFEATPYASVYKFSHDVSPAKAALGAAGCKDCHSWRSSFFHGLVLSRAFSQQDARPIWQPNFAILGISPFWVHVGEIREEILKPATYALLAIFIILAVASSLRWHAIRYKSIQPHRAALFAWILVIACVLGGAFAMAKPGLISYMTVTRFALDANHFWVGILLLIAGTALALWTTVEGSKTTAVQKLITRVLLFLAAWTAACGALMVFQTEATFKWTRFAYTGFDLGLVGLGAGAVLKLALMLLDVPKTAKP
jgi:hypothetical protein